jgi:serine/threonine-protein kinase RsbW
LACGKDRGPCDIDETNLPDRELVIRLEPRAEALTAMLDRLEAYAEATGLPSRVAYRLAVVCEELATNVAMHGAGGEDGATYVEVTVDRTADGLRFSVEDDGRPFDPLARAKPDTGLNLDEREIGGLGIHFVRSLVKDISYERLGRINRLTAVLDIET